MPCTCCFDWGGVESGGKAPCLSDYPNLICKHPCGNIWLFAVHQGDAEETLLNAMEHFESFQ